MYIVPMAWLYVALMMSVAEATSAVGTVLGACITFLLYGLLPVGIILYIMGTPARRRALRARQNEAHPATPPSALPAAEPDARCETPADAVSSVRKEP